MKPAQQKAVARIRRILETDGNYEGNPFPHTLVAFHVKEQPLEYRDAPFVTVSADREQGKHGTMLHALSHEHWLFFVGERGAITLKMGPKSLEQFHGRRWNGMNVEMK